MAFTAKDVQALRQATGAGMMDAKKALEANDGDMEAAKQWLREKGLAASAKRDDRENTQGVVALVVDGNVGAIVELKCETDFVAVSEQFKSRGRRRWPSSSPPRARTRWPSAPSELDDLKITLKENIELGEVVRIEAAPGNVLDSYLHMQGGRGVNAVLVEMAGGTAGAGPRHRRAHRLRPAEVPEPRRRAGRRRRARAARRSRPSPATRASPRRRCRRSSRAGSTASSRTSPCSTSRTPRTTSSRSPSSSASATIVRFAQVEIG